MHPLTSRNSRLAIIGSVALILPQTASRADRITIAFNPSHFSHPLKIDNAFFALPSRSLQVFRAKSDEGCELDRMAITDNTRVIEHVEARVVHDVVFADPRCDGSFEKIEDTLDYFAQDDDGNVGIWAKSAKSAKMASAHAVTAVGSQARTFSRRERRRYLESLCSPTLGSMSAIRTTRNSIPVTPKTKPSSFSLT